jgi:hypothetical protein
MNTAQLTEMQRWQEDQVLRTTRALGYDPQRLPPDDASRNFYVKALIRTRCGKNHPVKLRAAVFNPAWDRLIAASPPRLRFAEAGAKANAAR